ncbi:MAG: hypothetical protein QM500_17730 [Methylococcales bacterium]
MKKILSEMDDFLSQAKANTGSSKVLSTDANGNTVFVLCKHRTDTVILK